MIRLCMGCDDEVYSDAPYCDRCQEEIDGLIQQDQAKFPERDLDWFEIAWGYFAIVLLIVGVPCMIFNLVRFLVMQ